MVLIFNGLFVDVMVLTLKQVSAILSSGTCWYLFLIYCSFRNFGPAWRTWIFKGNVCKSVFLCIRISFLMIQGKSNATLPCVLHFISKLSYSKRGSRWLGPAPFHFNFLDFSQARSSPFVYSSIPSPSPASDIIPPFSFSLYAHQERRSTQHDTDGAQEHDTAQNYSLSRRAIIFTKQTWEASVCDSDSQE